MSISNNEYSWIPTPRYLCRKDLVIEFLNKINKGKFLEIGAGAGDLVLELAKMNYRGVGIDISEEAVKMIHRKLDNLNCNIKIDKKDLFKVNENFDIVIALELIEHFKNDEKVLKKIYNITKKNGYLILSVPARKKKWDINDKIAGHYRRYEKEDLKLKIEKCKFKIINIYSYGYPIANIAKPIRNYIINRKKIEGNKEFNTKRSGINRNNQKIFSPVINKYTIKPFLIIQKLFLNYDLGDGYLVFAKK